MVWTVTSLGWRCPYLSRDEYNIYIYMNIYMCKFRVNQTMYYIYIYIYTYVCIGMYNRCVCIYCMCIFVYAACVCVCACMCKMYISILGCMYIVYVYASSPKTGLACLHFLGWGWDGVGLASLRSVALAHIHDATQRTSSVVLAHILYAESW